MPSADERASWRTYRPFDEHGCAWRDEDALDMHTGQRLPPDELLSIAVPLTDSGLTSWRWMPPLRDAGSAS